MDTIEDLSLGPLLKGECAIKWKPCSFWYITCKDIMYSERTGSAGCGPWSSGAYKSGTQPIELKS